MNKQKMADLLYERLNGVIPKKSINDAIICICDYLIDSVVKNESVSIINFGTFSPYIFHAHKAYNIAKGIMQEVKFFQTVKFHGHITFLKFLAKNRESFK